MVEIERVVDGYNVKLVKQPFAKARIVRGIEFPLVLKFIIKGEANDIQSDNNNRESEKYNAVAKFAFIISTESNFFQNLIHKHGAVVLQGFNSTDPHHFAQFIGKLAQGSQLVPYEQHGVAHPRVNIAENVTSVNSSRGTQRLYAHQEFSRFKKYPKLLTFFAKRPTISGGEETLVHAGELYDAVNLRYPQFIDEIIKKGVYLSQTWPLAEPLPNGKVYSWKAPHSFGSSIKNEDNLEIAKQKAAQVCKEHVVDEFEWTENHGLKLHEYTQPIRKDPYSGTPIFFSSLPTYYQKYKALSGGDGQDSCTEAPIRYNNGDSIKAEYLDYLLDQSIELAVVYKFEESDIVLVNNYLSYHGRISYGNQPREILASFWDDVPENKRTPQIYKKL